MRGWGPYSAGFYEAISLAESDLEDEIYKLKGIGKENRVEIIEDLKEAFIYNNKDEIEEVIDKILEKIVDIEPILTFEEFVLLMYICYFTDCLKVLLNNSKVANIIYDGSSKEANLLKILVQEESSQISSTIEECAKSYIQKETDIFSTLERKVEKRIRETIDDFSYKSFEEVYDSTEIKQGDKVALVKAWVRYKDKIYWKLVSGLYSVDNNKIYLEKHKIEILGLNKGQLQVKEVEGENLNKGAVDIIDESRFSIKYHIDLIKNEFINEKPERLKKLMRSTKRSSELKKFDDILAYDISADIITKEDVNTLLLISLFYGAHNKLILNSYY